MTVLPVVTGFLYLQALWNVYHLTPILRHWSGATLHKERDYKYGDRGQVLRALEHQGNEKIRHHFESLSRPEK